MRTMTIDEAMEWGWEPRVEPLPEGDFRLTVVGLTDFELFAKDRDQLVTEWRTALRSHLGGYLKVQKVIPLPLIRIQEQTEQTTSTGSQGQFVFLSDSLQVRSFEAQMA
jgi:hypothetical protein